jgi:hypothetical protein
MLTPVPAIVVGLLALAPATAPHNGFLEVRPPPA